MSTETVKICDVLDCNVIATDTLELMSVANFNINQKRQDTSDGLHIWNEKNVDLCGSHYFEYRTRLPQMKLKQMLVVINAERKK